MAEIDGSVNNFVNNPKDYILCLDGEKIKAEKKGIWTWIKANILYGDSYKLDRIVDKFVEIQNPKADLTEKLRQKVQNYDRHHGTHLASKILQRDDTHLASKILQRDDTHLASPLLEEIQIAFRHYRDADLRDFADQKAKFIQVGFCTINLGTKGYSESRSGTRILKIQTDKPCEYIVDGNAKTLSREESQKIRDMMDEAPTVFKESRAASIKPLEKPVENVQMKIADSVASAIREGKAEINSENTFATVQTPDGNQWRIYRKNEVMPPTYGFFQVDKQGNYTDEAGLIPSNKGKHHITLFNSKHANQIHDFLNSLTFSMTVK